MSIPWWKFDKMLADRYGGEPLKPIIDLISVLDDDALFPSDHLIAELRLLGG